MTEPFIPFAKPCLNEAAIHEVVQTLESGWLTTGPKVKQFETLLQDYCAAPYALALNSATAGLHLALLALDLAPGDEVITSPLTFAATVNTIVQVGATPVFVDVDPKTLNMDLSRVEAAITPKTKVIMPVHFAGRPFDMDALYALAYKHQLRVIEDCAHALGARFDGQRLGSFGDIQVFSFHPNKNMTTGEGGAVVTRDAALAKKIETLRFHGIERFSPTHYDVVAAGYKYNMMDLQAAIGLHQLPQLDHFIEQRTAWVKRYDEALASRLYLQRPTLSEGHAWHLYTVRLSEQSPLDRDTFMQRMKDHGIGTGYHYPCVHLFSYYQKTFGFKAGDFPIAESISERIVSLPLFPHLRESEFERVIHALDFIFSEPVCQAQSA